jgi:DNA sulfur modification protein DndB
LEEANLTAGRISADVGGRSFPCNLFWQGDRQFISAVFPINFIVHELKVNSTERDKGIDEVRSATNRPLDVPHAVVTEDYINKNFKAKYILPPMTLNIQDSVKVYTTDVVGAYVTPGYLVVPYGVKFSITDGQHRQRALRQLSNKLSAEDWNKLKNDGIVTMITIEDNTDQVHQDFADCSKTKPLPKSLIAVYDKRNPANGIVIDLINDCALFKNKVDATAPTLSKKATKLLLVSQVRSFIKELCKGSSSMGDVDFEIAAQAMFEDANSIAYKDAVSEFKGFIDKITEKIPVLNTVSKLKEGLEMNRIPALRSEWLVLNSAGLNIIGRIGYEILQDVSLKKDLDKYINAISEIDWRKDAELWQGNIVVKGSKENTLKINGTNASLKAATLLVREIIGLPKK